MNEAHEIYVRSIAGRNTMLVYALALVVSFGFLAGVADGKLQKVLSWGLVGLYYVSLVAFLFLSFVVD